MRVNRQSEQPIQPQPQHGLPSEEAEWWDDNRNMVEKELLQAIRDGTVQRGTAPRLAKQSRTSKNITIRMPLDDIERARRLADRKGLGYQDLHEDAAP